jgi:hypothetical protein
MLGITKTVIMVDSEAIIAAKQTRKVDRERSSHWIPPMFEKETAEESEPQKKRT